MHVASNEAVSTVLYTIHIYLIKYRIERCIAIRGNTVTPDRPFVILYRFIQIRLLIPNVTSASCQVGKRNYL